MFTSRVERTISAAHHNGPPGNRCENNHGHDWHIVIELRYEEADLNEYGWGPDFGSIKKLIDEYDHGVNGDLNLMLAPLPPSAENLAKALWERCRIRFALLPLSVTVHEGKGNSVTYTEDDGR